jgi:hypothetical protein
MGMWRSWPLEINSELPQFIFALKDKARIIVS